MDLADELRGEINDVEKNILIIAGIFGPAIFLLFVLVIVLFLMIKDLKRKLEDGKYNTNRDNLNARGYNMYPYSSRPPPPLGHTNQAFHSQPVTNGVHKGKYGHRYVENNPDY